MQRDVGAVHDAIASYKRCLELDPTNRHAGGWALCVAIGLVSGGQFIKFVL